MFGIPNIECALHPPFIIPATSISWTITSSLTLQTKIQSGELRRIILVAENMADSLHLYLIR